jgi:hypothetical protein
MDNNLDRIQTRKVRRDIEGARQLIETILDLGESLTSEARTERLERVLEILGGRK